MQISVAQKSAAGKASYLKRKETRSTAVTEPYQRRCQQNVNNPTPTPTKKEEREDKLSGLPANTDAAATMTTIWNEEAGGRGLIPKANNPSPARRASCLKRWREDFGSDSEQWRAYCQRVAASPHLRGENDRAWRADLDWVLMPSHMAHIIEGRYDPAPFVNGHANDGAVLHLSISPDQERRDEETKWRMLIQKWTETKRWWYDGDPPGSRWCRAPATVLAEFGFPLENGAMKL